jgi:transposase-like protein
MEGISRKADGRRIFSVQFKRKAVSRILSGEKTLAELSRELEVQPAVLRNWMHLVERGERRRWQRARTWCRPARFGSSRSSSV